MDSSLKLIIKTWGRFFFRRNALGPFHSTGTAAVTGLLELAQVTSDDVVYDLGCGDARMLIEAAKGFGARGIGYEYDKDIYKYALESVKKAGVEDMIEIRREDALKSKLSDATVATLYLSDHGNAVLKPLIVEKLKNQPNFRAVSFVFDIPGLQPAKTWSYGAVHLHLYDQRSLNEADE